MVNEISVHEFKQLHDKGDDYFLLDVREPSEYDICNLGGHLIPLGELPARLHELDPSRHISVHCKMGGRGRTAVELLQQEGFTHVSNLNGGILAWANEIDPRLERY